jgi:hypothetical protein
MNGTIRFAPFQLEASFELELVADGIWEDHDEDIDIVLSNPRGEPNVTISDGLGTAYIRIEDPGDAGVLRFAEQKYDWGYGYEFLEGLPNGMPNVAQITVERVGGTSGRVSVDFEDVSRDSKQKNFATAGADYTPLVKRPNELSNTQAGLGCVAPICTPIDQPAPNTLIFEEGEATKTFSIQLKQDVIFE